MSIRKLMIALAVVALFVAACGSDTEDTTTTTAAAADTTTTTEAMEETTTTTTMADMHADWPDKIVFGFVPSQEQEKLQDNIDPFVNVLKDALGIDVEGIVTTDYTGLVTAMGTGQADVGAFGPFGYVLAEQQFPNLEVLIQSIRYGAATYHGQWFTNDPSICEEPPAPGAFEWVDGEATLLGPTDTAALQVGLTPDGEQDVTENGTPIDPGLACNASLDAVAGKTVAFTTETSTSGYVFPALQLINLGIDPESDITPTFAGGHDGAVTAVYSGDADFGVSFDDARSTIADTYPDVGSKVIVFDITDEIPNDVVAVRGELPDTLKDAIYDAIDAYLATDEGQQVFGDIYEWTAIRRAKDSDFEVVRDAAIKLGITEPD